MGDSIETLIPEVPMTRPGLSGLLAAALLAAWPALAQETEDTTAHLSFGGDTYAAGDDIRHIGETSGDLFAAGEDLDLVAPVGGTAHLAGRRIEVGVALGGPLYAAGYRVTVAADVAGAATLFGAEVAVEGDVAGNLRLFAREAEVSGALGGSAIITAQELRLDAPIAGDLMLAAEEVDWGEDARVDGQVIVYGEPGETVMVPERVASPDRVEQRDRETFRSDIGPSVSDMRRTAARAAIGGFIVSVFLVAGLATAAVAIAPATVAQWRETALARPGPSLVAGFLLLSTIVGSGFVIALTVIGIPLLPALLVAAGVAGYAGYVLGSYILGVGIWLRLGKDMPEGVFQKAGLAALGALLAGLIGLIPFFGWLVVLALALGGLGAIALHMREARGA
jgi:hypothetical protein